MEIVITILGIWSMMMGLYFLWFLSASLGELKEIVQRISTSTKQLQKIMSESTLR